MKAVNIILQLANLTYRLTLLATGQEASVFTIRVALHHLDTTSQARWQNANWRPLPPRDYKSCVRSPLKSQHLREAKSPRPVRCRSARQILRTLCAQQHLHGRISRCHTVTASYPASPSVDQRFGQHRDSELANFETTHCTEQSRACRRARHETCVQVKVCDRHDSVAHLGRLHGAPGCWQLGSGSGQRTGIQCSRRAVFCVTRPPVGHYVERKSCRREAEGVSPALKLHPPACLRRAHSHDSCQ
jgi:hypothetical protein